VFPSRAGIVGDGLDMGAYDRECTICVYSFGGGGDE